MERDENNITLKNTNGEEENYKILANFPFSSERKRMGIVVEHVQTGRVIFYLKGAEVVLQDLVRPNQRLIVQESCENLGMEGLRTLVISQKMLNKEKFEKWQVEYNEARASLHNREANTEAVVEKLEEDMELLGITGVEDKLQENVQMTIESFRNAGINVWMLTGDKVETATCIAISAGLKNKAQRFRFIKEAKNREEIRENFNRGGESNTVLETPSLFILVIDGTTLDTCLK
jgi:phospholipid-translocating ATPase